MSTYKEKGYEIVRNLLPTAFAHYLAGYFELLAYNKIRNVKTDEQVPKAHSIYGGPAFDHLGVFCLPLIEAVKAQQSQILALTKEIDGLKHKK